MEAALTELLNHVRVFVRRPDGEILHWTEGCRDIYGYTANEAVGCLAQDLLKTEYPESQEAIADALAWTGKWNGRLRQRTRSGRHIWTETLLLQRECSNPGGSIVMQQCTDITERVELEERSALLSRELQHRVRNILALVQSFVRMSFPDAAPDQRGKIEHRIAALAEAVKVLQDGSWSEARLSDIAREIGNGLGVRDRIDATGPELSVASDDAMGLSLALHELCTNALKYGALSQREGKVLLTWEIDPKDSGVVRVYWNEVGGPPVEPPARTGFGTLLIRKAIPGGAAAEINYRAQGLACELRVRRAATETVL